MCLETQMVKEGEFWKLLCLLPRGYMIYLGVTWEWQEETMVFSKTAPGDLDQNLITAVWIVLL